MKCSICEKEITHHANNAYPYKIGDCCDGCNIKHVIPLRIFLSGDVKNQVLIISTDGKISYKIIETEELTLETAQEIVGGYIEFYPFKDDNFCFTIDEEGILKQKEINHLALELFSIEVVGTLLVCPKQLLR